MHRFFSAKQVGVSNDLMLSSKNNPFMWMVIHGCVKERTLASDHLLTAAPNFRLITFNHNYVTNYPTVMFSTGFVLSPWPHDVGPC